MKNSKVEFDPGYCLFIPGPKELKYKNLISELSEKFGAECFTPHITLYTAIDPTTAESNLRGALERIGKISQFTVDVEGYECKEDSVWQCIYAKIKMSSEIEKLYAEVRRIFADMTMTVNPKTYFPHISLVYGDTEKVPNEARENEALRLRSEMTSSPDSFKVEKIELWDCRGKLKDWKRICDVPLAPERGVNSN